MKKSANGNMYEVTLNEAWELFGAHLSGARSALVCVVSEQSLDDAARKALTSSAAALGYGRDANTFVVLHAEESTLDTQALFLLIEGLDPRCIIATDAEAAALLGGSYRTDVPLGAASRLFGRTAVAFRNFTNMLSDGQEKQVAWALMKKLPKLHE